MATVMITGCSRGLGLEFTRQYLQEGWKVYASCRNPEGCTELQALAAENPRLHLLPLDIADNASIERAAKALQGQPLDLLVQNAGVYGPGASRLETVQVEPWMETLRINALAPLMVVQRLLDNLRLGYDPCVVLLSSKMGSMTDNLSGGSYVYRSSKAALNAVGKSLAEDLRGEGIRVLLMHPGWVKTDMGGPNALIDAVTSVASMRQVIAATTLSETGCFLDYNGDPLPW
ncbi:SDR family oxidoreductase [Aestuariirhabdus litorea]|uniref:SDR family oxidoreductase n=1 Tax=Aestuariirhabdus litorea TaxID=2528527 RepID=A0A3P3VT32_9GAMM|nr:SDR family oxidoreductase [Aestuariirhabdus litorea]RRJ83923.1 SDR family oxidoreductase [Aestuariirhabdus litorea]RWW97145.1 SDR family NAD(P)-dependent oxidoreductase [Endozoicomonadaceae bacterium GTF-13]